MEATGRYEFTLAEACFTRRFPVVIAKPISIRRYAGAIDQLAQTNRIDAQVIASYTTTIKPKPSPQKSKKLILIRDLLVRRRQLMGIRTQELNRIKIMGKTLETSCKRILLSIDNEIKRVEDKLDKLVEEESEWAHRRTILTSAPGVGSTLAYSFLSELLEIGTLNNRQIAKLVGAAPINHDSGMTRGKRRTQGGRAGIRTTLYMATLSATLCNPVIRAFYQKLVAAGKHKKGAITACMRKFITILNSMVKDDCVSQN